MTQRSPLSKGEQEVVYALWEIGPAGVRDIHQLLSRTREIDFSTVQTYLRRLETKGYATSTKEGRIRIYAARAKQSTVIRQTVNDFVDRLFGGETMPLVKHLIEDRGIDEAQIAELRELIERLEQKGKPE
ncbi:BlaI/MecI/CopY family transcriptional regulator [Stieleria varia]|uniref:Penicillinase repressor n=1 Tax=Stieleria varia TaxID=2528005 RepID=A0A5C6B4V8_9BACT|nr:BlaI/MecI/CopY family transcriptional regulator [Stieleria varia]TWU06316.1 Penicillinase repressor [Stieleria varia]